MKSNQNINCENCRVKKLNLINECSSNDLALISQNKIRFSYQKNQCLFREGDAATGFFCVRTGKIKVYNTVKCGSIRILKLAKTGDLLGYRALIENKSHNISAEAIESSEVCFIDKHTFSFFLITNHEFNLKMIRFLHEELEQIQNRLQSLAQNCEKGKVASSLIWLKEVYGLNYMDHVTLNYKPTITELSQMSGVDVENVKSILQEFLNLRIIVVTNKSFLILAYDKLVKLTKQHAN